MYIVSRAHNFKDKDGEPLIPPLFCEHDISAFSPVPEKYGIDPDVIEPIRRVREKANTMLKVEKQGIGTYVLDI